MFDWSGPTPKNATPLYLDPTTGEPTNTPPPVPLPEP